jgi:hypothetical protein
MFELIMLDHIRYLPNTLMRRSVWRWIGIKHTWVTNGCTIEFTLTFTTITTATTSYLEFTFTLTTTTTTANASN